MKILHVSCSPRGQAAESYRLSQKIIDFLLEGDPTAILVNRAIGGGAVSHIDENYATALRSDIRRQNYLPSGPCPNPKS